ncbi:MAG: hypothetical protein KDF64_05475 [Geminicoccaceae bacterium]|nr:hypothetical protein [Geminicoccaceae bacterium]
MTRAFPAIAVAAGILCTSPSPASALDMVAGGFGADPASFFVPPSSGLHSSFFGGSYRSALGVGQFTPRSAVMNFDHSRTEAPPVSLELGVDTSWLDRIQRPLATASTDGLYGAGSMLVGGGMRVADIGVMGGLGRTQLFGSTTDMVAAGLSIGPVSARVAFGQRGTTTAESSGVRDVMMFSTDLAAWSWLTLEGDVAFGTVPDEGEQAIGRVGVRLEF